MGFVARLVANAVGLWAASAMVYGITMDAGDASLASRVLNFLLVALVLTVVNAVVRPLVKFVSLPFYLLTLGLFFLVVNALMLMFTGWVSGTVGLPFQVDGFWSAFLGGIVVAIVASVTEAILPNGARAQREDN